MPANAKRSTRHASQSNNTSNTALMQGNMRLRVPTTRALISNAAPFEGLQAIGQERTTGCNAWLSGAYVRRDIKWRAAPLSWRRQIADNAMHRTEPINADVMSRWESKKSLCMPKKAVAIFWSENLRRISLDEFVYRAKCEGGRIGRWLSASEARYNRYG
jgi:hypothetical protein